MANIKFPEVLMEIVSDDANSDSIEWLPHGRSFIIRNHYIFATSVLPCNFGKEATYCSFIRELCRWKFVRIPRGNDKGAFYNKFFHRESASLHLMSRAQNGSTQRPKLPSNHQAFGQPFPSPDPKLAKVQPKAKKQLIDDCLDQEVAALLKPRREKSPLNPYIAWKYFPCRYCQEITPSTMATTSQSGLETSLARNSKIRVMLENYINHSFLQQLSLSTPARFPVYRYNHNYQQPPRRQSTPSEKHTRNDQYIV